MTLLPFGGFDATLPHSGEEAGNRLVQIANAMTCGQPVPPELAFWFFQAVKIGLTPQGEINADRFMRALGLLNAVGDDGKYSAIFKAHWSSRYGELKAYQPRNAFKTLIGEMVAGGVTRLPSRSTVNAWLDRSIVSQLPSREHMQVSEKY